MLQYLAAATAVWHLQGTWQQPCQVESAQESQASLRHPGHSPLPDVSFEVLEYVAEGRKFG